MTSGDSDLPFQKRQILFQFHIEIVQLHITIGQLHIKIGQYHIKIGHFHKLCFKISQIPFQNMNISNAIFSCSKGQTSFQHHIPFLKGHILHKTKQNVPQNKNKAQCNYKQYNN